MIVTGIFNHNLNNYNPHHRKMIHLIKIGVFNLTLIRSLNPNYLNLIHGIVVSPKLQTTKIKIKYCSNLILIFSLLKVSQIKVILEFIN